MAATTIIMAILGCGDAGTACRPVAVAPVRYESVAACMAAQDEVLAASDIMYPVVSAECRAADGAVPASGVPAGVRPTEPAAKARPAIRIASLRG